MVIRNTNDLVAQHTLRTTVYCEGVGLHSGQSIAMCVRPAAADSGISFVRKDVPMDNGALRALWHNIEDTQHCTLSASTTQ
jgi:UDP-3-O-[3-hydroxymyristoyl] N-acetylglucosamine deacetylase